MKLGGKMMYYLGLLKTPFSNKQFMMVQFSYKIVVIAYRLQSTFTTENPYNVKVQLCFTYTLFCKQEN